MSITGRWGSSRKPNANAVVCGTSRGSRIGASSTNHTPSANWSNISLATWIERRVLPVPPGPISVSKRVFSKSLFASVSSFSRPTKLVNWMGRLLGRLSSVRSGGNSVGKSGAITWKTRTGLGIPENFCIPMSRRLICEGNCSRSRFSVALEIRICPPCPADINRWTKLSVV